MGSNWDLSAWKQALSDLPPGVDAAQLKVLELDETKIDAQKGAQSAQTACLRLQVQSGGSSAAVYTEDLSEDPAILLRKAQEQASLLSYPAAVPIQGGVDFSRITVRETEISRMRRFALAFDAQAKSDPRVADVRKCSVVKEDRTVRVLNSMGSDRCQKHACFRITLELSLKRAGGSSQDGQSFACVSSLEDAMPSALLAQAVCQAEWADGGGLPRKKLAKGNYPVVLPSDVSGTLLYVIWKCFAKSFAANGASCFSRDLGKKIAGDLVCISDDPRADFCAFDVSLDWDGVLRSSGALVENGTFCRMMPEEKPGILHMRPGSISHEELLKEMGSGLRVSYINDEIHAVNIRSGDFSIPCGGVYYENGKPAFTVSQCMLVGNLRELFHGIRALDNVLELYEFDLADHYYCAAPGMLIGQMKISC